MAALIPGLESRWKAYYKRLRQLSRTVFKFRANDLERGPGHPAGCTMRKHNKNKQGKLEKSDRGTYKQARNWGKRALNWKDPAGRSIANNAIDRRGVRPFPASSTITTYSMRSNRPVRHGQTAPSNPVPSPNS